MGPDTHEPGRGRHVSPGCKLLHYFLQNGGFSGNEAGTHFGDFSWPCRLFGDTGAARADEHRDPTRTGLDGLCFLQARAELGSAAIHHLKM